MYAVALGYPLGFSQNKYLIEHQDNVFELTFAEASLWAMFNGIKQITDWGNNKSTFDILVSRNLIVTSQDLRDLYFHMLLFTPIRQGAAAADNNANVVFLGNSAMPLPYIHYVFWTLANGKRNVSELYTILGNKYDLSLEDFIKIISYLDERDLIFFI